MGDAAIARLSRTPWCAALISSPSWTPTGTGSRVPKASTEDSFFAETLGTERTIRACLTLRLTEACEDGEMPFPEVRTILELGDGVNGFPNIAHGGFAATMLDEVMGVLITTNIVERSERRKRAGILGEEVMSCFTAYLNTTYKKPLPTPSTVLCTAKLDRREGKKIYLRATIEDGQGMVYTVGEGMFVETRSKL
ncbi:hypothetical protein K458DRAFT_415551 [Lentithecium fluviatile CBS 122367]|uniref:Thioesterase domain-containing protein n=1 Tax=Lentithecium fluviatile CBS 122367 TaxID=1168545 RepID=A0A6G1JAY0_9PLEO|nr:hypothetical protein K458DRAFT_415551 [Lentithecium fluviatile CBS 122367]